MSSRSSLAALALVLVGCYAAHSPWERAAPDGSAISLRVDVYEFPLRHGFLEVRFVVGADGTVLAELRDFSSDVGHLEPCEPLDDRRALWSLVLASSVDTLGPSHSSWRVEAATTVIVPDGTTHPRRSSFHLEPMRAEHAALDAVLSSLLEEHCAR